MASTPVPATNSSAASRRRFLQTTGAAALGFGLATIISPHAIGRDGAAPANSRITIGSIGTGGQGRGNTKQLMNQPDTQVVAVCDVDTRMLEQGVQVVNEKYGNQDCKGYRHFKELLDRQDIDAVCVSTPDHWHALASVAAANAGKHVYCEKPLANSIGEGRAIVDAVTKNKVVLQVGSHERSRDNSRFAADLVQAGRVGKVHTLLVNLPTTDGHHQQARAVKALPVSDPPEQLDYDMWLGHTPVVPYSEKRVHFWWRFILAYGGGEMTDRGAHVIDLGQMAAGLDETGPVEIEARGVREPGNPYDVYWDYDFVNTYANGVKIVGKAVGPRGVRIEGDEGWIFIHVHGAKLEASKPELLEPIPGKVTLQEGPLGRTPSHHRSFLDAIQGKAKVTAPGEAGHRTGSVCHLNNIAMMLGRKLRWDPKAERFEGDDEANRLIMPTMRAPYTLG